MLFHKETHQSEIEESYRISMLFKGGSTLMGSPPTSISIPRRSILPLLGRLRLLLRRDDVVNDLVMDGSLLLLELYF